MSSVYFKKSYQRSFGTWPMRGDECREAIGMAIEAGYRSFDTAQLYGNEADVGAALATCGVPREKLLITTKVEPDNYAADRFIPSVEASLAALKIDKVDVLLLHWPPIGGDVVPPLQQLQKARDNGLATDIGVSNFNIAMMRTARATLRGPIATNQVEFHPLLDQSKLLAAASETGIPLASYASLARGEVLNHPEFGEIGAAYGKTASQVVLRWILQKGVSINTKSATRDNIRANFDVMDFTLSSIDMARIDAMTATGFRCVTADRVPWAPEWD